jgi:hypothetical protein
MVSAIYVQNFNLSVEKNTFFRNEQRHPDEDLVYLTEKRQV